MILAAIRSPGAVALIGAAAGVIGGVLGALAGGWATYKIEAQRQKFERRRYLRAEVRERERELAGIRGSARVWRTRFDDLLHLINSWPLGSEDDRDLWWTDESDIDTEMPVEDMKAVAAALTQTEWRLIDVALSAVRTVAEIRGWWWELPQHDRPDELANVPDSRGFADGRMVKDAVNALEAAIGVLDALSDRLPELPEDPPA